MKYYSLRISTSDDIQFHLINEILCAKSNFAESIGWGIEIIEKEDEYINFIEYFLSILEGKYEQLEEIGIIRDDISIWILYEYNEQCNMEFSPSQLKEIGNAGIALCISCWEKWG